MFAGHIGAALVIGRAERRVNVGAFVAAALLLDLLLWTFVLLGWESVAIPANFGTAHQAEFVFPYSHGLVASALWSAAASALGFVLLSRLHAGRARAAALIAAAVFSHWLLDLLVHQPELPLAGVGSAKLGFGLWQDIPTALVVEAIVVVVGVLSFVLGSGLPRGRSVAVAVLSLVCLAFTVVGMTIAPPPPSATAMAATSLLTLLVVCALAWWLGRN